MFFRFFRLVLLFTAALSGSTAAQLTQGQAWHIVEILLSHQNPLVLVEEISHDGFTFETVGTTTTVRVEAPRIPGRAAFAPVMAINLSPSGDDLVQVQVVRIATSTKMPDGGQVSFRPTVFQGLYSRADQGFQSMVFGLSDLAYQQGDNQFTLDRFEVDLATKQGAHILNLRARGFAADFQDVMDFKESAGELTLSLSIDENQAKSSDLMVIANRFFEALIDPGFENTNAAGRARVIPDSLVGLRFNLSLRDFKTHWLALRDQGPRETLASLDLGALVLSGSVEQSGVGDRARLSLTMSLENANLNQGDDAMAAQAAAFGLRFILEGMDPEIFSQLFSGQEGGQSAALGQLLAHMDTLSISGTGTDLHVESVGESALLSLPSGGFEMRVSSPYVGAPNYKDVALALDLDGLKMAYPALTAGLEPAWSELIEPILPDLLDLRLEMTTLPGDVWMGVSSLLIDRDAFVKDTTPPAQSMAIRFDGTHFRSQLLEARLSGTLTLDPDAAAFAVGNLKLELNDLRALMAAMQRAARVPNRTMAQLFTLGSVGLAAISGYGEPGGNETQIFNFEFQKESFPTINGRALPIDF